MSENLQKLLKDALLNNSYDYDAMHNTIKKTWMNSFSYLYALQNAYVEYEELFYFSSDTESRKTCRIGHLYLDKMNYANFNVDYDLIKVFSREEFRLSKFYLKEFNIKDIAYNPKIFLKMPIVIIDDQVIWDYKIKVTKDSTQFILPFRRNFVIEPTRNPDTDEIIYIDHKIQVLVVENSFYQRCSLNKSNLEFGTDELNGYEFTFKIKKEVIQNVISFNVQNDVTTELMTKWGISSITEMTEEQSLERQKEFNKRMKCVELPSTTGIMMCSIHYPNANGFSYELGTPMLTMTDDGDSFTCLITPNLYNQLKNSTLDFYISFWFMDELRRHTTFSNSFTVTAGENGAPLLLIEESKNIPYKMPIPVEDFIVLKRSYNEESNSNFLLQKNTDMLEMHYPNIYRVKDKDMQPNDVYDILYFYHEADDLKYTVLFDFYYTFLRELSTYPMEKVINQIYYNDESELDLSMYTENEKKLFYDIFKKIYDYQYFNHQYNESDFLHRYLPTPGNEDKEPIEYKDEILKSWIKVEPWVLRDYVLEQNKLGASYHLFTNTMNLSLRVRYNTERETGTISQTFDGARYVFAFNNEKEYPIQLNARVFVDGILIGDVYQERYLFMDYFYIPTYLVSDDSYIELEIFPEYTFKQEITFSSVNDVKEISLADPDDVIFPTLSDVYLQSVGDTARYDKQYFDITSHYSRGDILVETTDDKKPVVFTRLSKFSIKPNSAVVTNHPMYLYIKKSPRVVRFRMQHEGYAYIEIVEEGFSFNTEYIRIYRNGKLMPRTKYRLFNIYEHARIMFLDWMNNGDIIYIDITPYRYKEIYYQEELSKDDTLIDLKKIINKPFDIRYYDVYINGRKLSLNNVFSITPWQITLVNLKSNYNLLIYERERDWEYFGLDYNENLYYYSLDDLFKSGLVKPDIKNEMIKDMIDNLKDDRLNIYPNTNDEEKMDFNGVDLTYPTFYIFYYDEFIPKQFMNPDILQESSDVMLNNFQEVYQTYYRSNVSESITEDEKNRKAGYPSVICLDPDIYYGNDADDTPIMVYPIGHLDDDIDQWFLDESVEIPKDGNIDTN